MKWRELWGRSRRRSHGRFSGGGDFVLITVFSTSRNNLKLLYVDIVIAAAFGGHTIRRTYVSCEKGCHWLGEAPNDVL